MRAVVTGAGGGLGREFLRQLAAPGVQLVAADIDVAAAQASAEEARARGADVRVVLCDIADPHSVSALGDALDEMGGELDLLVNNAAIFVAGEIVDVPPETVLRALSINVGGIHNVSRALVGRMPCGGRVLNVTSLAGTFELPRAGIYAATKAAATSLSQALRYELAPRGIAVTTVCPSFIRTGFVAAGHGPDRDAVAQMAEPMFRWLGASPEHVVASALRASERRAARDIPALHGRLAVLVRRVAPRATEHAVGFAYRVLA